MALTAASAFSLSACGDSGSGGGVVSTPAPVQFTSFASVQAGTATSVGGITREGTVSIDPTGAVLQSGVSTPVEGSGSATFTLNASRQVTGLSIAGSQSSVSFTPSNSTSISLTLNNRPLATAVYNATGSDQAIFGDPYVLGFNYQTFGVWGTGLVNGSTGRFGATSVGSRTAASSIPTTGTVNYRGYAGGIYTDGAKYRYAADANFVVNFTNRTVSMSTLNQTLTDIATNNVFYTNIGQISGTMSYAVGSQLFSGNLTATGQTSFQNLSGTGSGTFYGPAANEIGGTFFLRGSVNTLVGGFGGKQ